MRSEVLTAVNMNTDFMPKVANMKNFSHERNQVYPEGWYRTAKYTLQSKRLYTLLARNERESTVKTSLCKGCRRMRILAVIMKSRTDRLFPPNEYPVPTPQTLGGTQSRPGRFVKVSF
jgi:hypothetical protein